MPVITPVTVPVGMVRPGQTAAERAIARIAGPLPTGKSLVKDAQGTWRTVRTPSQAFLDTCEWVFIGGHEYVISDELWAEIQGALAEADLPTLTVRVRVTEDGNVRVTEDGHRRILEDT